MCRALITETLIPPKDEDDTEEGNDKSNFRDFISNWLDKFRGNKTEMEKAGLPVMRAMLMSAQRNNACVSWRA